MLGAVLEGATLGLSVALPFGPVSLVCVQRSIAGGVRHGVAVGAAAASAQGIFATAALLGHDAVLPELVRWSGPIRWVSASVLIWLGLRAIVRHDGRKLKGTGLKGAGLKGPGPQAARARVSATYGSSLALALSNPMTVLPYLAFATGGAAGGGAGQPLSSWAVPGVVTGAAAWYAVLSTAVSLFRPGMVRQLVRPLSVLAGCILVVLGLRIGLG